MSFSGSKSRLCTAGSNGRDLVDLSALAHLVVLGPAAHLPCSGFVFSRLGVSPQLLCEVGPGGVTWSGPGVKDRVSNGRMCCKEPLMLRSGRLQSRQVAGRARGAGLPAPGLAEGRAHCGANRVGACCGEGQGAEQAHLAGEEGRPSRSPMDPKTYNNRSVSRSGGLATCRIPVEVRTDAQCVHLTGITSPDNQTRAWLTSQNNQKVVLTVLASESS